MSSLSFPIKDLTRRKFQTILTMLGLTTNVATTVFLISFGENIGLEIILITGGRLTMGFSYVFSLFIVMIVFLSFLAGVLITSFLISATMSERIRDVGIMKSTGCLTDLVFSYFVIELLIMVLISCIIGTIAGTFTSFAFIDLLNNLGFSISQRPLNAWNIFFIFSVFALVSLFFGSRTIGKAIRVKPGEALSPHFLSGASFQSKGLSSSRLGFAFKVASRNLMRRRSATRKAILCVSVVLTLTTLALAGGFIANQTTQSYVERAIGRDIIVVGHSSVSEQYRNFLSSFFETKKMEPVDFLDPEFSISPSLVNRMRTIPGIVRVVPGLALETTVYELPGYVIDPEEPDYYFAIGENRSSEALVLGVDPENILNEWLMIGRAFSETDKHSAILGDSLALRIFDNPRKQGIEILGQKFDIVGVCLDPLNNGNVVYVPFETLSKAVESLEFNLLFIRIDPAHRSQVLDEINREISGTELVTLEVNESLEKHLSFLSYVWSLVIFLPLSSLVTATLCLLGYRVLSIASQKRDLGIMRALGAKPLTIVKLMVAESFLILMISGAIGIFTGFFVSFVFLIPEPVITSNVLFSIVGWLLLALGLICLSALYPVIKTLKEPIPETMSQP
ncbi:MAG: ABC transporter permease [Candidatus Bathyarchaeota archaeon]|jgi:ABC-type antimicrobial peptide transport system permease subunit